VIVIPAEVPTFVELFIGVRTLGVVMLGGIGIVATVQESVADGPEPIVISTP
jgi:hypothetical protein